MSETNQTYVNITEQSRWYEANYRYRRPKIQTQHLKTKGVKTAISNWDDICRSLQVPNEEFAAVFKKKAKKIFGGHGTSDERYEIILAGNISAERLDQLLQTLIEKFIICPKCKLSELQTREGKIQCMACGWIRKEKREKCKEKSEVDTETETDTYDDTKANAEIAYDISKYMKDLYDYRDHLLSKQASLQCISQGSNLQFCLQSSDLENKLLEVNEAIMSCWEIKGKDHWNEVKQKIIELLKN